LYSQLCLKLLPSLCQCWWNVFFFQFQYFSSSKHSHVIHF
jgi:hypothetical protein